MNVVCELIFNYLCTAIEYGPVVQWIPAGRQGIEVIHGIAKGYFRK
jgi:hypothetical protein